MRTIWKIHITEYKSVGTLRPNCNHVRVFVDDNYHYGYFIDEHFLFDMLDEEQQIVYLQGKDVVIDVSKDVVNQIVDKGHSPFKKKFI